MARVSTGGGNGLPQINKFFVDWNAWSPQNSWNGKHLYFVGGGWDAVIIDPDYANNLPVGTAFSVITDENSYVYVGVNDNEATYLTAVGISSSPYGYDIPNNSIATIIKVDADRWIISGYGVTQD